MILTITPNLAWDLTYTIDELRPGASHRVTDATGRAGGKGVNVARVLRQLGERSHVLALAGGTTGEACEQDLQRSGVPTTLVPITESTRQSIAVLPRRAGTGNDGGHPTLFNEAGPSVTWAEWETLVVTAVQLVTDYAVDAVTVSGSLPPGVGRSGLTALLDALPVPVLVDGSGPALLWAAEHGASLLKPNRAELAEATGTKDLDLGVARLFDSGAGSVVVTDGAAGLIAFEPPGGAVARAHLPRPISGNPTGAGDAALAALAATRNESWPARLRHAVAVSAAAVAAPVAGEVDPARVDRLTPTVVVQTP